MHVFDHCAHYIFYLTTIPTLLSAALILPVDPANPSNVTSSLSTQLSVGVPDVLFKVEPVFDGPNLPVISCMMNMVKSLESVAYMDFWGHMQAQTWSLGDHREVGIIISPIASRATIERRFVVWGLRWIALTMLDTKRFQSAVYSLSYNKWSVGTIEIVFLKPPGPGQHGQPGISIGSVEANGTGSLSQKSNVTMLNDTASIRGSPGKVDLIQSGDDEGLNVLVTWTGSTVATYDVFQVIIEIIAAAAEFPNESRVTDFASPITTSGVVLSFINPIPTRVAPPCFQIHWLIETMPLIPEFMISQGVFTEVMLTLQTEGVDIASGYLRTVSNVAGAPLINPNISIS